jgi:hypothetical protein
MKSMEMIRRSLFSTMSVASAAAIQGRPAVAAAEFDFKLGVNTPESHPLTVRLTEAARKIGSSSKAGFYTQWRRPTVRRLGRCWKRTRGN